VFVLEIKKGGVFDVGKSAILRLLECLEAVLKHLVIIVGFLLKL
jgi:hypothetical protein